MSSGKRAPRSPAQAFDIVTASRCSTLKLGDQPTVGLDDFLMKCGTFTKRCVTLLGAALGDTGMLTLSFLIPCLLDPCIPLSHYRRSRKFATDSQLFTWMDENGADLTVRRIATQQPYHTHSSEQLVAGESSTSERIAIVNEQTGTLRIGSLGMRMLHMDILVVTSVVMLHRRWQRFHR